jgi:CRP-like cAMP-binding protein
MAHIDLLELPYFCGISLDDVVSLVDLLEPQEFAVGDRSLSEGDPCPPPLYITTAGSVVLDKRGPDGVSRNLAELKSPTLFGEIEFFCQIPPVATVVAQTRIAAFALSRPKFDRLFRDRHAAIMQFTLNVAQVACHRLAIADEMLAHVLKEQDLVPLRELVFTRMREGTDWSRTTGVFKNLNRCP